MTPDQEIEALRNCVRELWRGMKPDSIEGVSYWTEGPWKHAGARTITPNELEAIAGAFRAYPRDRWPGSELRRRGIPEVTR